ncbi:MAG TPA: hypothetical protein VGX25_03720 [Actinophytocola sp.]|uniref:hypothetical protein n=1 Tax=Actinophytocola sp. TaxID=1872138 RepID=UPI002DDD8470|nr:hypothetical protein [Actinophytocola sp.]HEV2778487.1 hypothetical protein [Actinophytocola sp.]
MGQHELRVPGGGLGDFARGLRELRRRAGNPSFAALAGETGYSAAILAAAVVGDQLPPLTVTLAYVSACGGDVADWADRWRALSEGRPVARPRRRRPRLVLVATGLVVLAGAGVILVKGTPSVPQHHPVAWTPAPTTIPTGRPPEFLATAGPGCGMDFTRQTRIVDAPGDDGWRAARDGASAVAGCDDRVLYSSHPQNSFQWRFMLDGRAARRCAVDVFVPNSPDASGLVWYDVADRFEHPGDGVGRFSVDQPANRGRWVDAVAVEVGSAEVMIQMTGSGAAGPMRLSCSRR